MSETAMDQIRGRTVMRLLVIRCVSLAGHTDGSRGLFGGRWVGEDYLAPDVFTLRSL